MLRRNINLVRQLLSRRDLNWILHRYTYTGAISWLWLIANTDMHRASGLASTDPDQIANSRYRCCFWQHEKPYTCEVFFRSAMYTRTRSKTRVRIKMHGLMIFQTWEFTACCSPSADCVSLIGMHLGSVCGLLTSIDACAPTTAHSK